MAKKATVSGRGLSAILDKKTSVKGKSAAKGKNVPVKAQKEVFEVIIRIPWDMHKIVMSYGETKKGYREVPTFNGSLKKIIPEFDRLQKENQQLRENVASLQRKDQVRSGILSRFRSSLQEVLSPVPELGKDNNFKLPIDMSEAEEESEEKDVMCPGCGHINGFYASECEKCGEDLEEVEL